MKRTFDFLLALVALPFAALAMLGCAIAIRLDSPGPAIFKQVRIGRNEKPFTCYKLRTMYADTANVPTHAAAASSITQLGKKLRALKLDELPQLINILKGEMSFVGPRPCLPSQTELIEERRKRGVYAIRPGITGLAQVKGIDMSDPRRLAVVDALYLREMSLLTDIRLIAATAFGAGQGDKVRK